MDDVLKPTCLNAMHRALGAKMVGFAGYEMPVQYPMGVMQEHLHTRAKAGLFDVSHMGQVILSGAGVDAALERLCPVDVIGLKEDRQRYGLFTNAQGGIEDDLMIARRADHLFLVVNAACKTQDIALLRAGLEPDITVTEVTDRALIALQGPQAEAALATLVPEVTEMRFMDVRTLTAMGAELWISRSGYTGEDGFEISIPDDKAEAITQALLDHPDIAPIGLGARDSLRLEAGLCLYGQDMDASVTPVQASLSWAISKARRSEGVRAGGFHGADVILAQMQNGSDMQRVGLRPEGRAPMRAGVPLFAQAEGGDQIGRITSGGFGPSVQAPVAMGQVALDHAALETQLYGDVRGKRLPVTVVKLPFVANNFKR